MASVTETHRFILAEEPLYPGGRVVRHKEGDLEIDSFYYRSSSEGDPEHQTPSIVVERSPNGSGTEVMVVFFDVNGQIRSSHSHQEDS